MKKIIIILLIIVVIFGAYLFSSDFGGEFTESIKRFMGYNIPIFTKQPTTDSDNDLPFLNLPEGFKISVVAKGLENPRVVTFDPKSRMLISETKAGRVSVLEGDSFETKRTLIENLKSPHGLDFYKDPKTGITYLYIAETHQVARYSYNINAGKLNSVTGENITKLPTDGGHFTRTIAFGHNFRTSQIVSGISDINTQIGTKLYIGVGSSCDICEESTWKRAAILESDPEGNYTAEFAGGLRNSVFFTFHPLTKEIWATEMGRDNLGDDFPPDEINIIKVAGTEHKFGARRYGWPFCYGNKVQDQKFKPDKWERIDVTNDCSQTEAPVIEIPAHSAPLGLVFIPPGRGWPQEWEGDLLVALHGSWNRSEPTGYKIVRYDLDRNGNVLSQKSVDFVTGWISENKKNIYGRPVDLKFGPDDALYISDDSAEMIYRMFPK
ncbi:MAG: hypothetical protein A3J46_05250 [Candidatus Yanofskybacteria bacterium RIFCSPHIGHO2_02_FULL_41_11]|uniref:Pyrroloquinoline quinone-dependent pyranose dehydrogenase beta-propeller domain-containing protein n=1 Tax=Candidatus Yanofskybacteria bacterium RIFCSPHIGHO2_02_FULL_41_11 TaxID=1802675 RepID=A0A1F8FDF4_9BACT|nr:MAG: hypothetical protein A3J46_05250 [Candidatus Yanofskybacteria bacterium RIFCSPHIGHO2_02_FULL_41_11]